MALSPVGWATLTWMTPSSQSLKTSKYGILKRQGAYSGTTAFSAPLFVQTVWTLTVSSDQATNQDALMTEKKQRLNYSTRKKYSSQPFFNLRRCLICEQESVAQRQLLPRCKEKMNDSIVRQTLSCLFPSLGSV